MKLELVNQQEYFDRYKNDNILSKHYITTFMNILRDKKFNKAIKKLVKTKYDFVDNISTTNIIMIYTALGIDDLEKLFGKGYETDEFGEGFTEKEDKIKVNKKTCAVCYFFKLNDVECMYFIDHRGSTLEHGEILEDNALQFYINLTELIITKTDFLEQYKEYLK